MRLTSESFRARWLILLAGWIVAAVLIGSHTTSRREYIGVLDGLGLREAGEPGTPLRQVIPARYADAHVWVRHAIDAHESGRARVRTTQIDNAPFGREVHWSSPLQWLLRIAGRIHAARTGESTPRAIERALLWFNAPLFVLLILALSAWVAVRAGAGAGFLVTLAMVGHPRFYEAFAPAYVDHHGLGNAAALGLLFGMLFMGAGWWQPAQPQGRACLPASERDVHRAATLSAICGAAGMWISAATMAPLLALVGVAGLIAGLWHGRAAHASGARFLPAAWQRWGRTGAALTFASYLFEYAPAHLGLRLEANHPFYALAWWGGAELVATLIAARLDPAAAWTRPVARWVFPLLAVLLAPATILIRGTAVFLVNDPFVGALRHFVAEGRSLAATVRQLGLASVGSTLAWMLVLVPSAVLMARRRGADAIGVTLAGLTAGFLVLMGFVEMRWWLLASAAQIALLLPTIGAFGASPTTRGLWIGAVGGLLLLAPAIKRVADDRAENRAGRVVAGDLLEPLYRDIAATLRAGQPAGEIVLLASPNAAAGISYYGRLETLGTLYWENVAGLRAAAEIFSAATDEEALRLIRARGVTHLALLSHANFLGEYFQLLHADRDPADARHAFGHRLLAKQPAPRWLQPIPYRPPPDLKEASSTVLLFKVAPEQDELERLSLTALAQAAGGDAGLAGATFERALAEAPPDARLSLCESVGEAFYELGADAAAVRAFRRGLEYGKPPRLLDTLAWILATSADHAIRDGRAALALAEPRARQQPDDPTVLSTLAAAYAEVGRFPEAVRAAERAVAAVRRAGDPATEHLLTQRLAAYRAGRAWRQ